MTKYMVLYKSSLSASELMASATPEEMQASMGEWMAWKESLDAAIGFEWGLPLQTVNEISQEGVQTGRSPVSGYSIMEGEKETIIEALKSHPHLKRASASIDLLEMLTMPGM